jgi:hypothetical protein
MYFVILYPLGETGEIKGYKPIKYNYDIEVLAAQIRNGEDYSIHFSKSDTIGKKISKNFILSIKMEI